jgi:hypothetical protein
MSNSRRLNLALPSQLQQGQELCPDLEEDKLREI